MKILQLELAAFGLFTNVKLDFSAAFPSLHIIYGANEAGKSTTRRALTHLLFGIPERTTDTFLHTNEQLRLGAILCNTKEEELHCYRRKGRKNTLLDLNNQPLEESLLQSFLNGMSEAQFSALFCFDHEKLRKGGEELLSGGGEVGETLFEAGTGTLKLHAVLSELDKEAKELFLTRGTKPRLNQTIRRYKEACQRMRDCSLSATKWSQHAKALEEARENHTRLGLQLHSLRAEQHRLERIQRTRPLLQRHQELLTELAKLTEIIVLPDDATSKRIEANLAFHTAQSQEKQAKQSITELQTQLNTIEIPTHLLVHKDTIDSLRGRLGSHQKAARDLPGVRTEMRTVEGEAQTLLRRIYPQLSLSEAVMITVTNPQRERLKQLADSYPALREKYSSIRERLEKISQQLIQQRTMWDNLPQPPDLTELKAALARALKQGELEENFAKEDKAMRLLSIKAEISLKQLGLWTGSLEALEQVALPNPERVESFDRRFKEIENDRQRIKERLLEARQRYNQATQKIDALRWAGEVPTENALLEARQTRQQRWQSLKHTQPTIDMYRAFEEAIQRADEIADRLRREAHRVAEQANLLAEQHNAQREQEQQTKKWHLANDMLANLQTEWEDCWKSLNIKPWSPGEMRSWLNECLNLRQQTSILRERRQQLELQQQWIGELCHELSRALAQLPNGVIPLPRLADLIEQAQACVAEVTTLQRQREDLEKQVKTLSIEEKKLATAHQQSQAALDSWQAEWMAVLTPLQLPPDTPAETARNVLDTLDQVLNKLERINGLKRRIDRMQEDAEVFQKDVLNLVQGVASELVAESVEQSVPILSSRLSQAEKDSTRYEQLQQRLETEQQRQMEANHQAQLAQAQLQTLLEQAHCHNLASLETAERSSTHKKEVQRQLLDIEEQLLELGEGLALVDLANAAAAVDIDQLPNELATYHERIQVVETERSELDQKIGELRILLKQMDGNDAAALAADEAQLALTEMQELSERYMQIHLAATVLRRSIERYREQHQGPLIRRASELFKRLTLGKFCELKAGYNDDNDQPILLGLRTPEGIGIPTSGMSEGTRDQLYLALRLASIERFLEKHQPLPLILDDILINFDDERSQATLAVLSELAEKTQILFFTHHPHLVELAQRTLPNECLVMHQL